MSQRVYSLPLAIGRVAQKRLLRPNPSVMISDRRRNALVGAALCILFGILLLARLSPLQGYVLAGCFFVLALYAIIIGLRD